MSTRSAPSHLSARPSFASLTVSLATGLYLFLITSRDFWMETWALLGARPDTLVLVTGGFFCLFIATCAIFSWKNVMKPLFILLLLIAAAAAWFMDDDGVFRATEQGEGAAFQPIRFAFHMLAFAGIPAAFLLWVKVVHRPFFWQLRGNLAIAVPTLVVALAVALTHSGKYASIVEEDLKVADGGSAAGASLITHRP
ncbi:lipid A ethanolaminephosphotransferase [Shinella sp. BE166]|uniref:phosphoethanolamine transferase domain-containing protein n=1 Tax=Shinella sp. BE166 TaxID=3373918 RepID=UPI003EBC2874